jgi:hypothetical protein
VSEEGADVDDGTVELSRTTMTLANARPTIKYQPRGKVKKLE